MKTMKYTTTGPLTDMAPAWVHAHERGETLPGMEITQDGGREAGILWRTWTATLLADPQPKNGRGADRGGKMTVAEYIETALATEPYEQRLETASLKDEAEGIRSLRDRAVAEGLSLRVVGELEYEMVALPYYYNIHLHGAHLRTACRIFRWARRAA